MKKTCFFTPNTVFGVQGSVLNSVFSCFSCVFSCFHGFELKKRVLEVFWGCFSDFWVKLACFFEFWRILTQKRGSGSKFDQIWGKLSSNFDSKRVRNDGFETKFQNEVQNVIQILAFCTLLNLLLCVSLNFMFRF